ncbi:monoheme cytochrome C [Flavobacterium sp. ASW18X]|uniref:monoheme cytochrome C n=1 Tax=Flavobacterium sp. ASW18X TaxID=2572595 RepID=UPI0010AEE0E6|nr:monoheme cytochrome C [Flavobacterium sp. ASW18X]TKD66987.1 monoheme cytochrome C [Flavobacterium sp. ASW18X]
MEQPNRFEESAALIRKLSVTLFVFFIAIAGILVYLMVDPSLSAFTSKPETTLTVVETIDTKDDFDAIENGIHLRTGFIADNGLMTVVNNCTNCHSAKLVTQNRMTKEGWSATIKWMQETQNLWDLGDNEVIILDYLAKNYAPEKKGRRENLTNIEWYTLN